MEECSNQEVPRPPMVQGPATQKPAPKFVSLPSKYQLTDHPIYAQAASNTSSLEEEFDSYKNAPPSPQGTDLVDFWNVSAFHLPHVVC
jgi:hypothetical protein